MKVSYTNIAVSRIAAIVLAFLLAVYPVGLAERSTMPFNGEIAFHKISLTIPDNYIRDSTQSTADFWVFEKGFYSQYIMLSRKDLQGHTDDVLNNYIDYLRAQGVDSQRDTFLQTEAVRSESSQQDMVWREMLFAHDGSLYAIAMRGGTAEELQTLLDTVVLHSETPEIVAQPDNRTIFERIFGYFFGK